ncbi:MAG: peptide chain release factor N(5)-glutamine methyltransferase [Patescibacteria group bacterium]|nr:peptide chain release factor N(5)-glutamine methyltransferase [Patescibacteria group bacterium]
MLISDLLKGARADKKLLEAEVLLGFVLEKSREWAIAHDEEEVSSEDLKKFHGFWVRLQKGEPLAYLTNDKEFFGLKFYVDKRVLVPRPETEALVELVNDLDCQKVVDVGTGCGNIACSLALNSDLEVCATEVSQEACQVARKNIEDLGAKVELFCGNLLEPVKDRDFDIIVANLPYIGRERHNLVADNVAEHEPDVALYGGDDGLRLYEEMFEQINEFGMKPRYILGEFGFLQGEEVLDLMKKYFPGAEFEIKQDLSGLDRNFVVRL